MLNDSVHAADGVEENERVAAVCERLHSFLEHFLVVLVHGALVSLLIGVTRRNDAPLAHVVVILGGHDHKHLLQIVLLELDLELLREVRHQEHLDDLAGLSARVMGAIAQNLVKMVLDAEASGILRQHTLDVKRARLQCLLILVSAHVIMERFIGHFGVPPCLLHDLNDEQREQESDSDGGPDLRLTKLLLALDKASDELHGALSAYIIIVLALLATDVAEQAHSVMLVSEQEHYLRQDRDGGHVQEKREHPALEEHVQVAVDSRMRAPVIHVELLDARIEQTLEHRVRFGVHKQLAFVHLHRIYVLVDGYLAAVLLEAALAPKYKRDNRDYDGADEQTYEVVEGVFLTVGAGENVRQGEAGRGLLF